VDLLWFSIPLVISTTTAYSRVRAGAHHPADALAGWAVGTAIGIAVPLAHYRRSDGAAAWELRPTGEGLAVTGRL
jgi:membrane-associated phospholipid phosphatase